jgi:hypothetical protein
LLTYRGRGKPASASASADACCRGGRQDLEDPVTTRDEPAGRTGKLPLFYKKHEMKIARAEVIIVFLALIRTMTAYYQLKTWPGNVLPAGQAEPIITGSLVAALFCLVLTLLYFFGRHRVMHAVFAFAIISLVLVKIFLFAG